MQSAPLRAWKWGLLPCCTGPKWWCGCLHGTATLFGLVLRVGSSVKPDPTLINTSPVPIFLALNNQNPTLMLINCVLVEFCLHVGTCWHVEWGLGPRVRWPRKCVWICHFHFKFDRKAEMATIIIGVMKPYLDGGITYFSSQSGYIYR